MRLECLAGFRESLHWLRFRVESIRVAKLCATYLTVATRSEIHSHKLAFGTTQ